MKKLVWQWKKMGPRHRLRVTDSCLCLWKKIQMGGDILGVVVTTVRFASETQMQSVVYPDGPSEP